MSEEPEIRNIFDARIEHFSDRSARWLFEDRENVRGLLEIVAGELVELIDFSRIVQVNRSFIPDNLREQESDMVFSVPFQSESDTDELLIYILIEHQSTVDPIMGFRLLFLYDTDLGFSATGVGITICSQRTVAFPSDSPNRVLHGRTEMDRPADP